MTHGDLDIIKAGLIERIEEVCRRLLPDGKPEGGQWVSFNPVTNDFRQGRNPCLKIRLHGGVVGAWKDWRCGDKGDVIDLVAYLNRTDRAGALTWGRDFLGLRAMTREDRENMRRVERERKERRETDDAERRMKKLLAADRLFNCTGPQNREIGPASVPMGTVQLGDIGCEAVSPIVVHASLYFAGRGVPLERVTHLNSRSFRISPQTEWWKGAEWKREGGRSWKAQAGPMFPAVHSAMRNRLGIVTCCHVTFLDPVRPAKAPVSPAKLMYGEALGAVIEISCGPSGVPFWMADRDGLKPCPLVIAEGIETALAFATTIPEARVWAGGSLAGVMHAPVDLDCVEWVLFARDNNTGNAQAQKQFDAALAGLESHGKRVVVEASHVGDDFNDLAKGDE